MEQAFGQIFFVAMIVVMVLVPLMLQPPSSERGKPLAVRGLVGACGRAAAARQPSGAGLNRERRLWLWAVAVVLVIYSTLGLAQTLAGALRERNLLRVSFAVGVLLVGTIVVLQCVRKRPGLREIGVALGVTAVYLTALPRTLSATPNFVGRTHLFEYGLVAQLIYHALVERRRNGRRVPAPAILAVVATALLGWLDEGIQALLPNRVYDLVDVGANALSGLAAVVTTVVMGWGCRGLAYLFRKPIDTA
ncbi:VanZ family protein [Candidatus Poribacteria bacterium]|jgi:VanZ family protein|nr:VanZ family protein [Candidatus Poribacteria bacterium]MBT5536741.1 VanZ family protein [Candidatus Poribacteria bacterium]MBT7100701.1 VanZ family protein [Candidatus Poribacteria bacterium]MBT7806448.1 VanZ family protein [Candidatus Poribacteria bacterium]